MIVNWAVAEWDGSRCPVPLRFRKISGRVALVNEAKVTRVEWVRQVTYRVKSNKGTMFAKFRISLSLWHGQAPGLGIVHVECAGGAGASVGVGAYAGARESALVQFYSYFCVFFYVRTLSMDANKWIIKKTPDYYSCTVGGKWGILHNIFAYKGVTIQ